MDPIWRTVLRAGYGALIVWSYLRRPTVHGAFVVVMRPPLEARAAQILLVQNSYKSGLTVPCGGIRRHETTLAAALRELYEEVGLRAAPDRLVPRHESVTQYRYREDHASFFLLALEPGDDPEIRIDNREVVWAEFVSLHETTELDLVPHLRDLIRAGVLDEAARRASAAVESSLA
jgi:8-oxo-dGTP pyrophosphatase MutT (NUDIX family)